MKVSSEAAEMASNAGFRGRLDICIRKCGSAYALARLSGMSIGAIHRYKNGSEPARDNLVALATAAGVSPFWLSFGYDADSAESLPIVNTLVKGSMSVRPVVPRSPGRWISIDAMAVAGSGVPSRSKVARGSAVMMFRSDAVPEELLEVDHQQLGAFRMPDSVMAKTIGKSAWGIVHVGKMPGSGVYCILRGGQITARHLFNDGLGNYRVSCDDEQTEPAMTYKNRSIGTALIIIGEVVVAGVWPKQAR